MCRAPEGWIPDKIRMIKITRCEQGGFELTRTSGLHRPTGSCQVTTSKQVRPSHAEARPFEGCGGRKAEGCGFAWTIGELDGRCYYDWCVGRRKKKNLAATWRLTDQDLAEHLSPADGREREPWPRRYP